MELAERVAVVTGGARGLGAAVVDRLHTAGAHVVYGDIVERADHSWPTGPRQPRYEHLDVRDRASWDHLATQVRATYGRLDILVNNAGTSARRGFLETSDEDWDRVVRTNLWAPWTGIRTFVSDLAASRHASVVNVGSIYGSATPPGPPAPPSSIAYQVSKAGLHTLTKSAAVELAGRGIRVNAVLPGVFLTGLLQDLTDEQLQQRVRPTPMGRPGELEELADAVAYLASDRASYVTGVLLPVDGGYLAG